MRLMTYNVLRGTQDANGGDRFEAVCNVLKTAQPDLLVLQECNHFDEDGERRMRELERALSMQGTLARAESGFHVAVFSRGCELHEVQPLSAGFYHVALRARLSHQGRPLSVLGVHLDPFSPERRLHEMRAVITALPKGEDAVVMGDFNSISPRDAPQLDGRKWPERYHQRHLDQDGNIDTRAIAALEATGLVDLAARAGAIRTTRPTGLLPDRPAQRLDYIFATAAVANRIQSAHVPHDDLAQHASDHLPVVVDLADAT